MPKGYPRIPRMSDRRRKIYRDYKPLRLAFLRDHPSDLFNPNSESTNKCQCCAILERRPRRATQVHHRKGRGEYELVQSTWAALCDWCHRYIHDHPKWAIDRGLLLPRATPLSDSGSDEKPTGPAETFPVVAPKPRHELTDQPPFGN